MHRGRIVEAGPEDAAHDDTGNHAGDRLVRRKALASPMKPSQRGPHGPGLPSSEHRRADPLRLRVVLHVAADGGSRHVARQRAYREAGPSRRPPCRIRESAHLRGGQKRARVHRVTDVAQRNCGATAPHSGGNAGSVMLCRPHPGACPGLAAFVRYRVSGTARSPLWSALLVCGAARPAAEAESQVDAEWTERVNSSAHQAGVRSSA